jgi:hypothetical protein
MLQRTPEPRASLARIALLLTRLNPPCMSLLVPGRSLPLGSCSCTHTPTPPASAPCLLQRPFLRRARSLRAANARLHWPNAPAPLRSLPAPELDACAARQSPSTALAHATALPRKCCLHTLLLLLQRRPRAPVPPVRSAPATRCLLPRSLRPPARRAPARACPHGAPLRPGPACSRCASAWAMPPPRPGAAFRRSGSLPALCASCAAPLAARAEPSPAPAPSRSSA